MARAYVVTFENVTVTAAQDLVQVIGATGKVVQIVRAWVGATNTTLVTPQSLEIRCRYLPATVSNGSGGTSPTFQKVDPGDAGPSVTALANNTSKATTSGTAVIVEENGVHIFAGYDNTFASRPVIGPSESWVFELLSTVSGTVALSGGVLVNELGG